MSFHANTFSVELCPKCHSSVPLTSYSLPFAASASRGYINPSPDDISVIESLLSSPTTQIDELTVEIARVRALLANLKRHRTHLEMLIQRSRVYMKPSPIRKFPTEILHLVFSAACTSLETTDYKTPLNISLVCSKWRDIALYNPALWTHIYVGSSHHARKLFDYYLQRCGTLPISINIDQPLNLVEDCDTGFPVKKTLKDHTAFMIDVSKTFGQWKVLELHVGKDDFQILMGGQHLSGFPLLESLTLALKGDVPHVFLPEALSSRAPVLSDLVLLDSFANNEQSLVWGHCILPRASLRTLRTNREDLSDLSDLYSSQINDTTTLVLCGEGHFVTSSIRLDDLWITNLILDPAPGAWTSGLTIFLKNASIPYLKALTIICPASRVSLKNLRGLLRAVPKLLDNSECPFASFSFIMNSTDYSGRRAATQPSLADTLLKIFGPMYWLESLCIIESVSGPNILTEKFIEALSGRALLPRLMSLELVWAESHVPNENVMPMLASRVDEDGVDEDENAKLTSVVLGVRNGGELPRAVLEHMKDLRRGGIRTSVW